MYFSKRNIINFSVLAFVLFVFVSSGQQRQKTPIVLKYADSLVGRKVGDISMKFCVGNVHFVQGNVLVWSDSANQYVEKNLVKLKGNVKIIQNNLILRSQEVVHNGNTEIARSNKEIEIIDGKTFLRADSGSYSTKELTAFFYGNVFIDDDSAQIWSESIIYERRTGNSFAYGNVTIKSKQSNTLLSGDSIEYYPEINYSLAYASPQLIQIDSSLNDGTDSLGADFEEIRFDSLIVESDTMESFRDDNREIYIFKNNVRIKRNNITAIASNAVFDKIDESITLYGKPVLWYDSTQLHADSIFIRLPKNKLEIIRAMGDAFAGTRSDSLVMDRIDQLSGKEIDLFFANDTMIAIESYGSAKSVYFLEPEAGILDLDKRSTDTIKVTFADGEAEYIYWLGPTQHEYIPQGITLRRFKDYYLPQFRWNDRSGVALSIKRNTDPMIFEKKFKY